MHSIVILGDSRRHLVRIDPSKTWKNHGCSPVASSLGPFAFLGGTKLVYDAISSAIRENQSTESQSVPKHYSYSFPSESEMMGWGAGETIDWELMPAQLAGIPTPSTRLKRVKSNPAFPGPRFLNLENDLIKIITDGQGMFQQLDDSFPQCAHIVRHFIDLSNSLSQLANSGLTMKSAMEQEDVAQIARQVTDGLTEAKQNNNKHSKHFNSDLQFLETLKHVEESSPTRYDQATADILLKAKHYNPALWQIPQCPDIFIVDDLNLGFRELSLPMNIVETDLGKDFLIDGKSSPDLLRQELKVLVEHSPRLSSTDLMGQYEASRQMNKTLTIAMTLLLERFQRAHRRSHEWHDVPVMEPVILASISDSPKSVFSSNDNKNTFWSLLKQHDWLRERTVLLLDAGDLRKEGLPISTGLSWERTAQDTIVEMRRSSAHRPFLQFGNVLVRFGVTGILHITQRGQGDWSYSLFFDPDHDDATWVDDEKDGVVLGSSAVILAAIVKGLDDNCKKSGGRPFLADLSSTINRAMVTGLRACRTLTFQSYGEGCWENFWGLVNNQLLFARDLFTSSLDFTPPTTSVPSVVLRDWSILNQSVQTRVGDVARDIVRFGVTDVLNQPNLASTSNITNNLRTYIIDEVTQRIVMAAEKGGGTTPAAVKNELFVCICDGIAAGFEKLKNDNLAFGSRSSFFRRNFAKSSDLKSKHLIGEMLELLKNDHDDIKACKYRLLASNTLSQTVFDRLLVFPLQTDELGGGPVAPILRYGKSDKRDYGRELIVIDRLEIDGYRAIEKLMRAHISAVKNGQKTRPLSLAIFGPPGSGKSSAVKRINETLNDSVTMELPAYNLSQFTGIEELKAAFTTISQEGASKVPIAFFDEFDCKMPKTDAYLGWLKYFLAPMEDGVFQGNKVNNAIMVFAGGTSNTFNDFSLEGRSHDDSRWIAFSEAKGPDFVSRLRGHLNIVGINPAGPDDQLYLVRRALLIRTLLSSLQELAEGEQADIEEDMLRAILHVPTYRYGGRAVRMLLELCCIAGSRRRISASAVPPIQQLNMLVDGKAFLDLLNRVTMSSL